MSRSIAIIGGGPAGLIAADSLGAKGYDVHIFERKPSFARKFLMAGRGGLNLTHSEDIEDFIKRYGEAASFIEPIIRNFPPSALIKWCENLGEKSFIGSSGRVFPESFKASPLLRAILNRLNSYNVTFHTGHNWLGWDEKQRLLFRKIDGGATDISANATLLALGGASWAKLGSNGDWGDILKPKGIEIMPFAPSNCGFKVRWSDIFKQKYAGTPLKSIELRHNNKILRGEVMFTQDGIEGGGIYALSAPLRRDIYANGKTRLTFDLKPDLSLSDIIERLQKPRGKMSFTRYLGKTLNLANAAIGLLMERDDRSTLAAQTPEQIAAIIKNYQLNLEAPFAIDRAISSAGGISLDECDDTLMLKKLPGVFAVGEMLDWEAPTGGYLLQGCFAMGYKAAQGIDIFLHKQ